MSAPVRATAVVVTYNSGGQIADCLDALDQSRLPVVVVDNASTDDTLDRIGARPGVRVLANPVNRGFAAAVNQAWRAADHDHDQRPPELLLLVNPDCVVPPATVAALLAALADDSRTAIAGPALVDADGRPAPGARRFESLSSVVGSRFGGGLLPVRIRRRLSRAPLGDPTRPVDVDWICGACLAVRVELLRRTGGLDERFFLYYEDEDLCRRAHDLGRRVVFVAGVHAAHLGGASSRPGETWPHLYRSMITYFGRHHPGRLRPLRAVIALRAALGLAVSLARPDRAGTARSVRRRAWREVLLIAVTDRPGASACRTPGPDHARALQGVRP